MRISEYKARGTGHRVSVSADGCLNIGLEPFMARAKKLSAVYLSLTPADRRRLAADLLHSAWCDELPIMSDDELTSAIQVARVAVAVAKDALKPTMSGSRGTPAEHRQAVLRLQHLLRLQQFIERGREEFERAGAEEMDEGALWQLPSMTSLRT